MEDLSPDQQPEWHPRPSDLVVPAKAPSAEKRDGDGLTSLERLEAARPQLEQLVTQMAPDIRAGRWDVLLGDDVSGRLPTLILRHVIARAYADRDRPAPKTYFVAMGKEFSYIDEDHPRIQDVKSYLASGEKPQRVLFVTDNVAGGGSIGTVLDALDELGIPGDVASAQVSADEVEYVAGRAPYSLEAAQAVVDKIASQGRIRSEEERQRYLEIWMQGSGHAAHDPGAKYYGIEKPISGLASQPFHLSRNQGWRAQTRDAVGVEKYGGPVTEGLRHHALREIYGDKLPPDAHDDRVPPNPDQAELRRAASKMADELYQEIVANNHGI